MDNERIKAIETRLASVENRTDGLETRVGNLEVTEREMLFKVESIFSLSKYFTEVARDIKKDQHSIKTSVDYIANYIMRAQSAES
jgi:hypothetical protein